MQYLIECSGCGEQSVWRGPRILSFLQGLGMLRRGREPDDQTVRELFEARRGEVICPACGIGRVEVRECDDDPDDWGERRCEVCRAVIPVERLSVMPDSQRCAGCQAAAESAVDEHADEDAFCPRCGGRTETRLAGGVGLTRYREACTQCGWTS